MTEPNWNEAPEGAQRYHAALHRPWLRKDSGENGGIYWWSQIFNGWIAYGGNAEGLRSFNEATPRPSEHLPLFQTEQGEEIERLKAELVEATEMALGQAKTLIEKDKRIAELERMWSVVFDGHAVYQACGDDRITPSLLSSFLDGVAKAGKEAVDRLREGELK